MNEKKINWTRQQLLAVSHRNSDIMVTASAGTGKTAVLSGRCVDIVSDKSTGVNLSDMLVLTFTDMAAEQMRAKIAERLRAEFAKTGDRHIRYQLMLLDAAQIGTIHSFCKRLITEYFYQLDLDPTFGIIDSDEQKLIKADALEKTIEWAWQQNNLRSVLEQLFDGRDLRINDGFITKIISLSDFLDGALSRENWYQRAIMLADSIDPFSGDLGQKQRKIVDEKLQHILSKLEHAQEICSDCSEDENNDWPQKLQKSHIVPVEECIEFSKSGDWNKLAEMLRNFDKPTTRTPKNIDEDTAAFIKAMAKEAIDDFKSLSKLAVINPDYLDQISGSAKMQTKILVELVKKFDQFYKQAKRAINRLDFADLEHYALKLLTDKNDSNENPQPSQLALQLRTRYKHIFVDEYQDINVVQRAILELLGSGDNLFVVGDVKQSIYAFRGAEPKIFIKDLKSANSQPAGELTALRVDLNANWRCEKEIIDFVNEIFSRVMTASFTGIDYAKTAQLQPAVQSETKNGQPVVELHILDEEKSQSKTQIKTQFNSRQRQAMMLAQRIGEMVPGENEKSQFQIYDKQQDKIRDVQYRDIVILMRSPRSKADDYVQMLRLASIPVSCQAAGGYFEATEISDILCLLKVIDNPQRDIELAAVLRSPLFEISDSELAKIKMNDKKRAKCAAKSFYDCLLEFLQSGADKKLTEKIEAILSQIENWRTLARRASLADLLWRIYRETDFMAFVLAMPNGRVRKGNLLKLHERAIQFESFATIFAAASLARFVEFIEKLQETKQDWTPAQSDSAAENAVRIISVHKSKGLEFPVVFLAELQTDFNTKDVDGDCLADFDDTLGLQIVDRKSNSKLNSLAHQVIAEQKKAVTLAEEMRILYVAMTRARERLILTASQSRKKSRNIIRSGFYFNGKNLPDWQLENSKNHLEWILYGLSKKANIQKAFEIPPAEKSADEKLCSIKIYAQQELEKINDCISKLKSNESALPKSGQNKSQQKQTRTEIFGKLKKALNWRYEFDDISSKPAKLTVTQLTHQLEQYGQQLFELAEERRPQASCIGSATHLLIASLDLAGAVNEKTIQKTKEKLLANGAIAKDVAKQINVDSIIKFFKSELGRAALDSKNQLWREWPFTFTIEAEESKDSNDEIIVQGIIDMLIQTPDGLLIVDFKTDNIKAKQMSERAENYRKQLELYAKAASAILKSDKITKWLYFLTPADSIEVE
ncbi:MAG: helicase-exonuclease AddAB subunit AddA [Planctomycetes bacterium]|nr:helicase-exonuclease AddAB subunit AddA [Planctomycetota bacterium]